MYLLEGLRDLPLKRQISKKQPVKLTEEFLFLKQDIESALD